MWQHVLQCFFPKNQNPLINRLEHPRNICATFAKRFYRKPKFDACSKMCLDAARVGDKGYICRNDSGTKEATNAAALNHSSTPKHPIMHSFNIKPKSQNLRQFKVDACGTRWSNGGVYTMRIAVYRFGVLECGEWCDFNVRSRVQSM